MGGYSCPTLDLIPFNSRDNVSHTGLVMENYVH